MIIGNSGEVEMSDVPAWWEANKESIIWGGGERGLPWSDLCKEYQEEITRLYQEARK